MDEWRQHMLSRIEKSKHELEAQYQQIVILYDFAEELLGTVEMEESRDPEAHLELVEPLVAQVADSADVLGDEYVHVVGGSRGSKGSKMKVETAARKLYAAIAAYKQDAKARSQKIRSRTMNLTNTIVEKIRSQLDRIVVIFLEYITLALDKIMTKLDIDRLRHQHVRVAFALHQMSTGH